MDSMIQYECRMRHKDGEYRWLLVREIVFKADDGNITQVIGAALDINRRKEMEKTILQNTLQLAAIKCKPGRICLCGQSTI